MTSEKTTQLPQRDITAFRILFIISALWNFSGSIPGITDPPRMFEMEFGHALTDPIIVAVYRGAWVTSLLYGFGFLAAAYNPQRHTGIVLMGGLGKALFALNLLFMFLKGWTSNFAIVVILGDVLFVAAFVFYFFRVKRFGTILA